MRAELRRNLKPASLRACYVRNVRATVPAYLCLIAIVYCSWELYRARNSYFPLNSQSKVEVTVTVTGPDGRVIKPIARAPGYR
jgi:hypothetical protein